MTTVRYASPSDNRPDLSRTDGPPLKGDRSVRTGAFLEAVATYQQTMQHIMAGLVCAYCGDDPVTFDHVVPRSKGGTDDPENLVPACRPCNASKSDKPLDEWIANLERYIKGFEKAAIRLEGARRVRGS